MFGFINQDGISRVVGLASLFLSVVSFVERKRMTPDGYVRKGLGPIVCCVVTMTNREAFFSRFCSLRIVATFATSTWAFDHAHKKRERIHSDFGTHVDLHRHGDFENFVRCSKPKRYTSSPIDRSNESIKNHLSTKVGDKEIWNNLASNKSSRRAFRKLQSLDGCHLIGRKEKPWHDFWCRKTLVELRWFETNLPLAQ